MFYPLRCAIPFERGSFGGLIQEPFGLDRAGEPNQRQAALAAFLDVNGDQEFVPAIGQFRRTARGEQQFAVAAVPGDAIGKGSKNGLKNRCIAGCLAITALPGVISGAAVDRRRAWFAEANRLPSA